MDNLNCWVVGYNWEISSAYILYTSDGGLQWENQQVNFAGSLLSVFFIDKNIGWAIGDSGTILATKNGGQDWVTQVSGITEILISMDFINNNQGWIASSNGTILQTSNGGNDWQVLIQDGLPHLRSIDFVDSNNGWLVGMDGKIMHTSDGGGATFIEEPITNQSNNPDNFHLSQNYPNPFNPSTTIEFTLPKSELTTLKVYNILGKEVATLVSENLNQGNHTFTFDGMNLASGIYYYQLVAGEYREVKKMILLR